MSYLQRQIVNWKFVSMMKGYSPINRTSLKEAIKDMIEYVKNLLATDGIAYQVLETALWIEQPSGEQIFFYDARDIAIEAGWLVNGKWID